MELMEVERGVAVCPLDCVYEGLWGIERDIGQRLQNFGYAGCLCSRDLIYSRVGIIHSTFCILGHFLRGLSLSTTPLPAKITLR